MFLAACGGGGVSTTPAPQSASASQSVGSGGGTLSISLYGETATVAVPAGAFATAATVHLTLYGPTQIPVPLSKQRKAQSLPSGAVPLTGLTIDAGGAQLKEPLTVAFTGLAAPASGNTVMLAGNANGSTGDVATTAYTNSAYTETANPKYPGMTLVSATTYVLYTIPTANVAPPSAVITVAGSATATLGTPQTYTATEATGNGFPFLNATFGYTVDSPAIGTIGATSGVLTPGALGAVGNVVATDPVSAFSGKLPISVTSQRPGAAGLTATYTGTLSEAVTNYAIATPAPSGTATPTPVTQSTTSQATVNVSTAPAPAPTPTDGSAVVTVTSNESDASSLTTLTSTSTSTVAYQTLSSGLVNVRTLKNVTVEGSGVTYEHDYGANNGLQTVLPESASAGFTNDAQETYLETDPGIGISASGAQQVTTTKTVLANGSYTANIIEPSIFTGAPATDTEAMNTDFSASVALASIDPTYLITYPAPSGGSIAATITDSEIPLNESFTLPVWWGTLTSPKTETDTISAASALPTGCTPPLTLPGAAYLTQQNVTTVDSANGTLETRQTSSYDVNGLGTVCVQVSDTVQTFYDYSGQEGYFVYFDFGTSPPILQTTESETLVLQSTNVATVASTKRTSAALTSTPSSAQIMLPIHALAAHVQHLALARAAQHMKTIRANAAAFARGGSIK